MENRPVESSPAENGSGRGGGAGRDGGRADAEGAGRGVLVGSRRDPRLGLRSPRIRGLSRTAGGRRRPCLLLQRDRERDSSLQHGGLPALLLGGRGRPSSTRDRAGRLSAQKPRAGLREAALATLFFLAATILFTWPIAPHLHDGLADIWDSKLDAWILHWDYHQIFRNPLHLFDANIFYPSRYALAFSENLLGAAIFGFPLYAAGISTLTAYNVLFLLGMLLSAVGAWALARYVTHDAVASCVAGLVYAFVPWRLSQVAHFQFQWGGFLPLSLLFLLKYWDQGRRRDQALFALFLAWNAATNVHYAIFSALLFALVLCYEALSHGRKRIGRLWGSLGAAALAVLLVIPLYVGYVKSSELYGAERGDS